MPAAQTFQTFLLPLNPTFSHLPHSQWMRHLFPTTMSDACRQMAQRDIVRCTNVPALRPLATAPLLLLAEADVANGSPSSGLVRNLLLLIKRHRFIYQQLLPLATAQPLVIDTHVPSSPCKLKPPLNALLLKPSVLFLPLRSNATPGCRATRSRPLSVRLTNIPSDICRNQRDARASGVLEPRSKCARDVAESVLRLLTVFKPNLSF